LAFKSMFWKYFAALTVTAIAFMLGFPIAEVVVHGFDLSLWPVTVRPPGDWFAIMMQSHGLASVAAYHDMLLGRTEAFGPLGLPVFGVIIAVPLLALMTCFIPHYGPRRDPAATYGDARWTNRSERKQMRIGLELGLDPDTKRPVRIMPASHLVTIAPPRTGKTSGLLIPNLLVPNRSAWHGSAVVIDPKGEAYRATMARRQHLGRIVRCLDPGQIVGGTDRWNPLARVNPDDVLYLQRVARALLPDIPGGSDGAYFHNRAVDLLVGAFTAANAMNRARPLTVAALLGDPDRLAMKLEPIRTAAADNAKAILAMDARSRDSILSTAAQSFAWCADHRLQRLTQSGTFALADLCRSDTDLFITLPTEDIPTLKPLLRWLLCDLFATVRRNRPREPLVCFIDEAAALGRFEEILLAAGELPGYNFRLWTFWQDRSQIRRTYGEDGAATLLNTAEIVTFSDLPLVQPDEREFLSRALGDYTLLERVETMSERDNTRTASYRPTAVRLKTADAIGQIPATQHIILPNSHSRRPLLLDKTRFDDPRLRPLRGA
jgi:type IV secretion system protein VirD4